MAGASLPITVTIDDREVRAALERLANRAGHLAPALAEIGEVLVRSTQDRFGSETGPDGERWAENSDTTLLRHLNRRQDSYTKKGRLSAAGARRLRGKKILTDRGYLGDLIHPQLLDGGRALAVGSNRQYAAVQQFGQPQGASGRTARGAPIPWGDIPARPFLGLSDDDRERVLEILRDYLAR